MCLVSEKRAERTTEGGLDVAGQTTWLTEYVSKLQAENTKVSLSIDPEYEQISAAVTCGADAIELHTGAYARASIAGDNEKLSTELTWFATAMTITQRINDKLLINARHGLTRDTISAILKIEGIYELNIGHALIADAVFVGLAQAVTMMKAVMYQ